MSHRDTGNYRFNIPLSLAVQSEVSLQNKSEYSYTTLQDRNETSKKQCLNPTEAIDAYIEYMEVIRSSAPRSLYEWRRRLLKLNSFFKKHGKSILNTTRDDIYRYISENSKKHDHYTKEPDKLLTNTVRKYLCDLLKFYEFCDRFNICHNGDKATLDRMRYLRAEPRPVTIPMSLKEIKRVLNEPISQIYRLIRLLVILHILYASGIRISELLNLKVNDIDLDELTIRFIGKGDNERLAFITDECAGFIRLYMETARPFFLKKESPYLIINQNGEGPMTNSTIAAEIKEMAGQSRINRNVYPHLFRHTFANHLHEAGMDMRYIQELMGHKWCSTTQKYLPQVSWDKLCRDYGKAFDHPNKGLHLVKDRDPMPAILDHYGPLKFLKRASSH